MKTGRTIQEVGAEILRQSQAKEDYLVNTNSIVMENWDGRPMLHLKGENGLDLIEPLEIQRTAHRQIGDYLGIPRKYYERMMDSDVGLLSCNVNRWFQLEPEQRELVLLRFAQQLKLREIAQITGLPLRTVQSRLRAALKTLKMQLEKEDWR